MPHELEFLNLSKFYLPLVHPGQKSRVITLDDNSHYLGFLITTLDEFIINHPG